MIKKLLLLVLMTVVIGAGVYIFYLQQELATPREQTMTPQPVSNPPEQPAENQPAEDQRQAPASPYPVNPTLYDLYTQVDRWIKEQKGQATDQTIAQYTQALQQSPNDAEAHFILAKIYLCLPDQEDKARMHFTRMLELSPAHPAAETTRFWLKDYEERQAYLAKWKEITDQQERLSKVGDDFQEYVKMARIYRKNNHADPARSSYQNALRLVPGNTDLLLEAGLFLKDDWYPEALGCFNKLLQLQPQHPQKLEIEGYIKALQEKIAKQRFVYAKEAVAEKDLLDALEVQLNADSLVQKKDAIERLGKIKSPAAVAILCRCIAKAEDKAVHRQAVSALREINIPAAQEKLKEILYDPQPSHLKIDVLLAYQKWGGQEDIAFLNEWLKSPVSDKYQEQGQWVIGEIDKRLQGPKADGNAKNSSK